MIAQVVEPKCSYFGICGGCAFQNRSYEEQLELKRQIVQEELRPFGLISVPPTIPSLKPYHYRNMISMTVKRRQGMLRLGFMGQDQRLFVPIEACAIADERLNQYLPHALKRLESLPPKRRFRTSQIALRVSESDEVVTTLRDDREKILECTIEEKQFSYAVSSFFQNNVSILESLVQAVRFFLEPNGEGVLLDLYSGVGLFGVLLADSYDQVFGFEEGYQAVQHARQNVNRNGVSNISFLEGRVEVLLPRFWETIPKSFSLLHVIVDPPRMGMKEEVIEELNKLPINRLVYVSCELSSLVRDLRLLEKRFKITAVQPLDLFPQTKHVETIVLLEPC